LIHSIRKRDGRIEDFRPAKIAAAIGKAFEAAAIDDPKSPSELTGRVVSWQRRDFRPQRPVWKTSRTCRESSDRRWSR